MAFNAISLWFIVGLVLVLLEFVVPGVILVFLGIGAWVAALAVSLGLADTLGTQMAWFGASSLAGLLLLRRLFKGWFEGFSSQGDMSRNLDEFTGREVVVTEAIPAGGRGAVEFKGTRWTASGAHPDDRFEPQERALISRVDGLCLVLSKPQPQS